MLYYKIDILAELKKKGYSTYRLKQEKLMSQATLTDLRAGKILGSIALDRICSMLGKQPGSIIGWKPDEPEADTKTE